MNREQLKALGLTDEQIEAVMKEHGKTVNTTKEQLESLTEAKKKLEADIVDRDKQLATLKKAAEGNEELQKQIQTLQDENKTAKEKYDADLKELTLTSAIKTALVGKVHDESIVAGLVDRDKLVIDGEKVVGLDEQLKTLQESHKFLFKSEDGQGSGFIVGGGGNPNPPAGGAPSLKDAISAHFQAKS